MKGLHAIKERLFVVIAILCIARWVVFCGFCIYDILSELLTPESVKKREKAQQTVNDLLQYFGSSVNEKRESDALAVCEDSATEQVKSAIRALEEREKSLNERQKAFDTREDSLEQKARYLTGMPPENAVAILLQYDNDRDILEIFRVTDRLAQQAGEDSLVAYWLSQMPAERGAELTRKMSQGLP